MPVAHRNEIQSDTAILVLDLYTEQCHYNDDGTVSDDESPAIRV